MTTATKFSLADAMKLVGVTQLSTAIKTDDTYNGVESYMHFGYGDISFAGSTNESAWLIIRLQFPKLRDDGKWSCQVGMAYIRQAKGNKFTAVRPVAGGNDMSMFKNVNSSPVMVEDLFAMEFLHVDHQAIIEEWLVSGNDTLRLAPANSESFLDIVPVERIVPIKGLDGADNANAGAAAKNPIGFNTFHGEGFIPVSEVSRGSMGGRKLTGPKVTLGGSAKPNVVAPAVADAPIAPAIAPAAVVAPAAVPADSNALIKTLKDLGFSLKEIIAELPHLFVSAAPAPAPAPIVESDDEYSGLQV